MNDIISQLQTLAANNQLLATITSGSVIVWLVSNLKSIWSKFINLILFFISFNIENQYEDNRGQQYVMTMRQELFNEFLSSSKALIERTKQLDLGQQNNINRIRYCEDSYRSIIEDPVVSKVSPNLTYGYSLRWFMGALVYCNRYIKNDSQKIVVCTTLRVFFARKEKYMKRLNDAIQKLLIDKLLKDKEKSHVAVYNGNVNEGCKYKRSLDSIFTNNNEHIELYNDIKKFIDNRKAYEQINYPYKYAALLYGVPGSGKTSTILAIASALRRDVDYIDVANITLMQLLERLNYETNRKIFVFEDIDAAYVKSATARESKSDDGTPIKISVEETGAGVSKAFSLSLSDLLNVTDGLLSTDGAICLFTTNHAEKLDPAFLRAGRMNMTVKFNYLNGDTASRMIRKYLDIDIPNLNDTIKPAELQEEILNIKIGKSTVENLKSKFCKAN